MIGERFSSRVAASLLINLGVPELVTHSVREFEDVAVELASGGGRRVLSSLRSRISASLLQMPTFDTARITRNLERSYAAMWEMKQSDSKLRETAHLIVGEPDARDGRQELEARMGKGLADAIEMQTRGDFKGASITYRRLLSSPVHPVDAWHLLGLLLHQLAEQSVGALKARLWHAAALCVRKAIAEMPGTGLFHSNLAEVLRIQGDLQGAAEEVLAALALGESTTQTLLAILADMNKEGKEMFSIQLIARALGSVGAGDPRWTSSQLQELMKHLTVAALAIDSQGPIAVRVRTLGEEIIQASSERSKATALKVSLVLQAEAPHGLGSVQTRIATHMLHALFPYFRQQFALVLQHHGDFDGALSRFREFVTLENELDRRESADQARKIWVPRPVGVPVLAIYCNEYGQTWWPRWGPSSIHGTEGSQQNKQDQGGKGGLGGSEEAVVYLSREMAKLGYWVEIYTDPPDDDLGLELRDEESGGGIVWYPFRIFNPATLSVDDTFVAWRYHISVFLGFGSREGDRAPRRFVWLQDISPDMKDTFTPAFVSSIDGFFVLSNFHTRQLSVAAQRKSIVTPNALDPRYFVSGENSNTEFIYASAPNRGLEQVLQQWPRIYATIPGASLHVYYGFSKSFMTWGRENMPGTFRQ